MRTLKQSIAEYLKCGVQPRTFVRVVDDETGAEILFAGTKTHGDYEDRLDDSGVITQKIDPVGGMAEVSDCTIKEIMLDQVIKFYSEAELPPLTEGVTGGAGRMLRMGTPGQSYSAVRNATTAAFATVAIVTGRSYNAAANFYQQFRGFLQFAVPSTLATCEGGYIELTAMGLFTGANFGLLLAEGTWGSLGAESMYAAFTGWASSGNYAVTAATALNETCTTAEYPTNGTTFRILLNAAGRAAIVAAAGGTIRFALLSDRDTNWTSYSAGPSGNEFVMFDSASARLNLRYNTKRINNQKAEIYVGLEPLPADHTGMDLVYTGVVDNHERTDDYLTLYLTQNDFKKDCMVPRMVINGAGIYQDCDPEIIGEAVPVLYGDITGNREHREAIGAVLNGTDSTEKYGNGDFAKAYAYALVGTAFGPSYILALVAGHALKAISLSPSIYESSLESFAAIAGEAEQIEVGGAGTGRITIQKGSDSVFPYYLTATSQLPSMVQPFVCKIPSLVDDYHALVNHPEYAVDKNPDNWMIVSSMAEREGADAVTFVCFREYGPGDLYDIECVVMESLAPFGYTDNNVGVQIGITDTLLNTHWDYYSLASDGQHVFQIPADYVSSGSMRLTIALNGSGFPAGTTHPVWVRNICIVRGYKASLSKILYIGAQGKMYDGLWTYGRTGSKAAGDLIANQAHVIESLARDEMGLDSTEINMTSFDTAYTAVGDAVFAFQLLDRARARELLKDLGRQSGISIWWDEADKLKCWKFDSTKNFPHSGTDIPGPLDIIDSTGQPVGGICTTHPLRGMVRMYRESPDTCRNNYVFKYAENYATGSFSRVITVNKDGHSLTDTTLGAELQALCLASYNQIKTENTYEIEAWGIRDEDTAELVLAHLVRRLSRWPWRLEVPLDIDAGEFEETDFVNVRADRVYEEFGTAVTEVKKWETVEIQRDVVRHEVTLVVEEV